LFVLTGFACQASPRSSCVFVRGIPIEPAEREMASSPDYDTPRPPIVDLEDDGVEELKASRTGAQSPTFDLDEAKAGFGSAAGDITDEELTVAVVPMRSDEFRCARCFLVHHRSQLADRRGDDDICQECV
jgi:hypothetical protein